MTSVADLRVVSDSLTATSYPILEPLNAPEIFGNKLARFGDIYNLGGQSHLYRYLVALCGDAGAGQLKKEMLLPRLEQALSGTNFGNLDKLYGNPLALPRISAELYTYDPETDILTGAQWDEVFMKDASYRARCLIWMRALIYGPTPDGIALAALAATGIEADVWERYQYVQTSLGTDFGKTSSTNEFVVIPRTTSLTLDQSRGLSRLLDIIKPTNTIGTVYNGVSPRTQKTVRLTDSSSTFFNIQRLVTGRSDITWPVLDSSTGSWISTAETEAPTLAFMNRQESVTYLSVLGTTSSSIHVGQFSPAQQSLFSHLNHDVDDFFAFLPDYSFDTSIAPVNITIGWNGGGTTGENIVVNNNYPVSYFTNEQTPLVNTLGKFFWASVEATTGSEWITYDLGRLRPLNYIHFEICQKPIDWTIQYYDGSNWINIPTRSDYPVTMSSSYLPSLSNPWMEFDVYFNTIQASQVRINFTRRSDPFPVSSSDPIPFSIDLRGVNLMHTMPTASDFVADTGVDILGNNFRTAIVSYSPSYTNDGLDTQWKSKPNPSRWAIESLYFDLRLGSTAGLMSVLDTKYMDELDDLDMANIETFRAGGQLVDEIFIDPITYGQDMHFYYSDDDSTGVWDNKLWVPIPRDYILKRGFHSLPRPTMIKYFKIEFSNLCPFPYEPVQTPTMPPVTFNRFPLWVNNYFLNVNPITTKDVIIQTDTLSLDPLQFGFVLENDNLVSSYEQERTLQLADTTPEVTSFIQGLVIGQTPTTEQTSLESTIEYHSPVMWQSDLISNLDPTRALSRVALQPHDSNVNSTGWNAELALPQTSANIPVQASTTDLSKPLAEKTFPTMFFPIRCRHYYQVCQAPLTNKIAYMVGIKEVGFYRRDYTSPIDESIYVETLDDTAHISSNDFVQNDWRYEVS